MRVSTSLLSIGLAIASTSVIAAGCAGVSRPRRYAGAVEGAPRVDDHRLRNLHRAASRETGCPEHALTLRPLTEQVWEVSGCGLSQEYAMVDPRGFRRSEWQPIAPLALRASNELSCPASGLAIQAPTSNVRTVSGCGRSATYALACGARACEWVMSDLDRAPVERPAIEVRPPAPSGAVVVVPDRGTGVIDRDVDIAIRGAIDARRGSILGCAPGATSMVVRARWDRGGQVLFTVDPPWSHAAACVQSVAASVRVTTGTPGELAHVVQAQ
jgi:hypothetical protein